MIAPTPLTSPVASALSIRAWRAVDATLALTETHYDRQRMAAMLLKMWPSETTGEEPAQTRNILARLRRALRRERSLARANPLRYDVNRHIALIQAWRAESAMLRTLTGRTD